MRDSSSTSRTQTAQFFNYLGSLQFHKCMRTLQKHQQGKGKKASKTMANDEVLSCLRRFVSCENMYYSANFSTSGKKDLHGLYSLLSSNLSILSANAPAEVPPSSIFDDEDIQQTNHNHYHQTDASPSLMSINVYNNSSPSSISPSSSYFVDYYHKTRTTKINSLLIEDDLVLSKPLLQDCRILIQLRLEMIAFYRMLARTKAPHKFDNHGKVLIGLQRYIDRITHEFLSKHKQNSKFELDILFSIMKCDANISRYKYKEAVFNFWKVKHLLKSWQNLHLVLNLPTAPQPSKHSQLSQSHSSASLLTKELEEENDLIDSIEENILIREDEVKDSPNRQEVSKAVVLNENHFAKNEADVQVKKIRKSVTITDDVPKTPEASRVSTPPQSSKQRSIFKSIIGAIAGAQPPPPPKTSKLGNPQQQRSSRIQINEQKSSGQRQTQNGNVQPRASRQTEVEEGTMATNAQTSGSYVLVNLQKEKPAKRLGKSYSEGSFIRLKHSTGTPDESPQVPQQVQSQAQNQLIRTNLFKWFTMLFGFSVSKFTFYFRDVLSVTHETPQEFHEFCACGIVNYMSWVESFNSLASPHSVHIIYDSQGEKLETSHEGYSLRKKLQDDEQLNGIRSYPCVFSYPSTIDKESLMQLHWPNLISLIMDNNEELDLNLEAISFTDLRMNTSYYICKTDQRMYLCTIFEPTTKGKPKLEKITHEFMYHMNMFLRNQKLFSYLV